MQYLPYFTQKSCNFSRYNKWPYPLQACGPKNNIQAFESDAVVIVIT